MIITGAAGAMQRNTWKNLMKQTLNSIYSPWELIRA
jgi:hypothetical protein